LSCTKTTPILVRNSPRDSWATAFLLLPSLCLSLLLASGCAGPRRSPPDTDPATLSDEGFQAYLNEVPLVTVDEAYRAMLILADGEDTSQRFEERRDKLESRGIAKPIWGLQAENVIDAGSVAYMVCRICKISGGVNARLIAATGLGDRRYALRELIYRQMLDDAVDYQFMRGSSLHTLLRKADALMEQKGLYESLGVDLTDEQDRDERGELIVPPPVGKPRGGG
jgi:hypothetical protein